MKAAIVLTTIRIPELLIGYMDNLEKYEYNDDVGFIIIGDRRTPHKAINRLVEVIRKRGHSAEYWDPARQRRWLIRFPNLSKIIPWNSDCRRNIGYLLAHMQEAEIIIALDDDNFVTADDYYGGHSVVGDVKSLTTISSANKWFNPCSMLETSHGHTIYPRGFPYSRRWKDKVTSNHSSGRIVLNMGLWTGTPDADAITHLNEPVTIKGLKSEQVMLAPGTFCPINTQNTAFHKDILPCYYYVLMGAQIGGLKLDRYGDIWSGYFAKKVIDQVGDRVSIGKPLTDHRRNIHDLFKDLKA